MPAYFANFPLLQEDSAGRVSDWFEKIIPYHDMRAISDWSNAVRNPLPAGIGQPNWARQLTPRLNTWYSPTGASRWGFGYFLADGKTKSAIISAVGGGSAPLNLTSSSNGTQLGRSITAYCLPPHPVSTVNSLDTSLWIIPVVDQRYFWQFIPAGNTATTSMIETGSPFNNWNGVIFSLCQLLPGLQNLTFPQPPTDYLMPNQWDFCRLSFQSAAVALDIALASVGMRLVPDDLTLFGGLHPNGPGFAIHDWPTAAATRDAGFVPSEVHGATQVGISSAAAGDLTTIAPNTITTTFRYYANGLINDQAFRQQLTIAVTPSQVGLGGLSTGDGVKYIRSRALWNFTLDGTENQANLQALAQQIASDYWGWASWFQDQAYPGISRQRQTGFDDYREYNTGTIGSDGSKITRTRVHTMPHNFYQDDMLHWDNTVTPWMSGGNNYSGMTWEWGNVITGTLQGPLLPNSQQVITVTRADAQIPTPALAPSTFLLVNEVLGLTVAGGIVTAVKSATPNGYEWDVVSPEAPPQVFYGQPTALTDCTAGATVTFNVFVGTLGTEAATGGTISAYVRKGVVFASQTYRIEATTGGYECVDPSLQFRGQPGADIASDAQGSMVVYTGNNAGVASMTTISSIRNDSSCTVKASKLAYAEWLDSLNGWAFDIGHTS